MILPIPATPKPVLRVLPPPPPPSRINLPPSLQFVPPTPLCCFSRMFQSLPLILFNLLLATSIISASFDVSPPLPPLVAVITFHYSEARIPHLVAALNNLDSYPSQMETIIVTNDGESTQKAIGRRRGVGVRVPPKPLIASDPHKLTWYHRQIFQERRVTKSSQDVIYLYLEDDIIVPHDTLRYFSENADRVFEKVSCSSST